MSSELEARYRQFNLTADIKQAKVGVFLLIVPLLLYVFNDFQFFGLSLEFYVLSALRLWFLAFTVWLLAYFNRVESFRLYDRAVFAWGLVGVVVSTVINASRPQNFLFHVIIVIATIVIIYLVIPQRFLSKVILSAVASLGEMLILLLVTKALAVPELFSVTLSLVLANVIGFSTSRILEAYRFKAFQAHEEIANLARLASENPDPVLRVSRDGVILYANPAAMGLFGGGEIAVGKPLPSFIQLDCGLRCEFEVKYGGRTFLFVAAPVADAGYVNLYGLDITERKQAEERLILHERRLQAMLELNKMVEASEKEVMDFALGAIERVTSSEFAFIGLLNEDETVMTIHSWSQTAMKECKTILKPMHYPISEAGVWAEPVRQRKPVFINDYSAPFPHKKGYPEGHVPIKRYLGVPVFEKERVVAIAAVANKAESYSELDARSVTPIVTDMWRLIQRRNAEEKLKESARKIEVMNEKLRVSGGLTRHDVRNKLSAVTGFSFLLKKKYADHADIVDAASSMEKAVGDSMRIFEFARLYEQLGVEELKYVDVARTVDEAVALFSGLSFKVVNDCRGLSLLADSFLRQFFYNLLDNTRKYGVKAAVARVFYERSGEDALLLIYEDDGVGIAVEDKQKLFTEGFSTGGGTGFGLFLIKRMMDVYGWAIREVGEPGKGARFVVTVPKFNQSGRENWQII
ncbi:MAG: GAF domain-containing protein [Candidatus Bathyarchaeota archaeon]|nr:GAF domain-containing protein [Candidatus Bathyarchaeota archaeon]